MTSQNSYSFRGFSVWPSRALLAGLGIMTLIATGPSSAQAGDAVVSIGTGGVKVILDSGRSDFGSSIAVRGDGRAERQEVRRHHGLNGDRQYYRQRFRNQERRIQAGLDDGSLTRHEARRLYRNQSRIHEIAREARADGIVTPRERARLERSLDRQSRRIYRQRHDYQVQNQRYRYDRRW